MKKEEVIESVEHGSKLTVDLSTKKVKLGHREVDVEFSNTLLSPRDFEDALYELYEKYKRSVPSEQSDKSRCVFSGAVPYEKLSLEELVNNEQREVARARLELFVLEQVKLGMTWNDIMTLNDKVGWYYQNPKDRDLVLIRDWFGGVK